MNKDLFKSALDKCVAAERDALGCERWGHWNEWMGAEVPYSAFVKTCFGKCRQRLAKKKIWQELKKVTDIVTKAEFEQLLRFPEFYRGWNFAQRYLFEEEHGLNKAMHVAMEEKCHRLPSPLLDKCPHWSPDNMYAPCAVSGVSSQVVVTPLSPCFRLVEIRIVPHQFGDTDDDFRGHFILELNNRFCVVLALGNFNDPYAQPIHYDALSPLMLKRLEFNTRKVRETINQRYFPIYTCSSVEDWLQRLQVVPPVQRQPCIIRKHEQRLKVAKVFLKETCKQEHLASCKAWNAFKKAFGIGEIIRLLDKNPCASGATHWKQKRVKWSEGAMFRVIWLELPYDIEIPIFRKDGALYLLRTVPDLSKV